MQGEYWIVNSERTMANCLEHIKERWAQDKWLRIQIQSGEASTPEQRGWMHILCRQVAGELYKKSGNEDFKGRDGEDWIKTTFKRRYGLTTTRIDPVTGQPVPALVSTENYSRGEKCHFIDQIMAWAADHDITIDPPEDYKKMKAEQVS